MLCVVPLDLWARADLATWRRAPHRIIIFWLFHKFCSSIFNLVGLFYPYLLLFYPLPRCLLHLGHGEGPGAATVAPRGCRAQDPPQPPRDATPRPLLCRQRPSNPWVSSLSPLPLGRCGGCRTRTTCSMVEPWRPWRRPSGWHARGGPWDVARRALWCVLRRHASQHVGLKRRPERAVEWESIKISPNNEKFGLYPKTRPDYLIF